MNLFWNIVLLLVLVYIVSDSNNKRKKTLIRYVTKTKILYCIYIIDLAFHIFFAFFVLII